MGEQFIWKKMSDAAHKEVLNGALGPEVDSNPNPKLDPRIDAQKIVLTLTLFSLSLSNTKRLLLTLTLALNCSRL